MRIAPVLVILLASLFLLPSSGLSAQSAPCRELYATDALGRALPESDALNAPRPDRYVGIFYFLWVGSHGTEKAVYDISKVLEKNPQAQETNASPPWGPPKAYHHWAEPLYGYYRAEDPWVLRRHANLLADAGVDFLIFDTTNAAIYEPAVMALLKVFEEQRSSGSPVPQIAFMVNTRAGDTAQRIYETLYKPGLYREHWFHWQGKPLLICDPKEAGEEVRAFFSLRKAHWPFEMKDTHNAWHWEATYPQPYSYDEDPKAPEQVNVSVGQNLRQSDGKVEMMSTGHARGRAFHQGRMDERPDAWHYGFNFEEQWRRAHELDPEVVFITGWNEWIAMQLNTKAGPAIFCDLYNGAFSRDVEMMQGGYGDNYYLQMAGHIRRFKGVQKNAAALVSQSIDMQASFAQWDAIETSYWDHHHECLPRDHAGCGDHHYRVDSGRNDFTLLKMAQDQDYLYCYAQCQEAISDPSDAGWMWLLLSLKGADRPNWEGFHYLLRRNEAEDGKLRLEACTGDWSWKEVGEVSYRVEGAKLCLALPKALLPIAEKQTALEFKWVDNWRKPGDMMDLYTHGDTAPDGRFRYRYTLTP